MSRVAALLVGDPGLTTRASASRRPGRSALSRRLPMLQARQRPTVVRVAESVPPNTTPLIPAVSIRDTFHVKRAIARCITNR